MKKIELQIVGLSHSVTQTHHYAVVLGEKDGNRRLPVIIGGTEAQAIAVAIEKMVPNRPFTHDLFKNALETFQINLKEIVINNLVEGIFYSSLICEREGEYFEIDSRTSDALAMAVRFDCPIFTSESILDSAGVPISDDDQNIDVEATKSKTHKTFESLSSLSMEELNKILEEVLAQEDYEKAASIRDEINRRK